MRYAALSAAVFGGAMFLAPSSPIQQFSLADSGSIINKTSVITAQASNNTQKSKATLASTHQPAPAVEPVMVTVAPGDSMIKIALETGTTYQRIYDANPIIANPDAILPGQELRIPTSEEVLAVRELPPTPIVAAASVTTPQPATRAYRLSTQAAAAPTVATGSVWDRLAACESGGNWSINTGNGYYGGLQFTLASWQAVGGTGMPNEASREEQILRGEILQQRGGWGNWPACTAKLGIR